LKRPYLPSASAKKLGLNWNDLRFVLAVSRTRAVAPAARALGVNQTTVARRIARAEAILGARLFDRIDGILRPTDIGRVAIERAERIEVDVALLQEEIGGSDTSASGSVRVTSIPLVINHLLVPALSRLYAAHPRLHIEAVAEPRNLSLTRRDADIALRLARPAREQSVVARRVGTLDYAVYGPSRPGRRTLPWITYEEGLAALPHVAWLDKASKSGGGAPALTVNDSEVALHAIRAGVGRSLLPRVIADGVAGLRRLSGIELSRELWLLVHPELRNLARIRAVIGWLDDVLLRARGHETN
jgi:DNA-binding transcriptional LysR family regulator